ncbi:MAG: tyrosine-type recombinase/integrase [Sporichthyaceae bacterium]
MAATQGRKRQRGFVRQRGNSWEVRVFAGQDPITGKKSYLGGTAHSEREAERLRVKLLAQVQAQRGAATRATLAYALDAWLESHEAEHTTVDGYRGYVERTIKPALGDVALSNLTARMLEQFYGQLRRCRARCNGKPFVEHREIGKHECKEVRHTRVRKHDCSAAKCRLLECQPHVCRPMSPSTVRQIHSVISGALSSAVRWDWISSNPASVAKKPRQANPQPKPPTAAQAALIMDAAWEQDEDWGTLVWLAMMTGARRGELLGLRWPDVHWDAHVLEIRRSYTQRAGRAIEKDTKTHQMRRVALDETTLALLAEHRDRVQARLETLARSLPEDAFVFSYEPDHSRPCNPDSVSHRYVKMCAGLSIDTHLHALRHYSATELIRSGVDVRTVAGRLGHGGGGVTTLRVYAAWVAESDKRAAQLLAGRHARPGRQPTGES